MKKGSPKATLQDVKWIVRQLKGETLGGICQKRGANRLEIR